MSATPAVSYCRVTIDTEARGRVYRKDFDAQHLFSTVARLHASDLITQGLAAEGDSYRVRVIPRYTGTPQPDAVTHTDHARASRSYPAWLELDFENGGPHPDRPLSFFTLELRFPDSGLIYRRDQGILNLTEFWANLQTALVRMHVLQHGDRYTPNLYARHDDAAEFHREEVTPLPADDGEPLFELVETEASAPTFPPRTHDQFTVVAAHDVPLVSPAELAALDNAHQDDVQIYIRQGALTALQAIARREGVDYEQGGMLVGQVFSEPGATSRYHIAINDYLVAEGATANAVELRYTFDAWQHQTARLRERFPGQQIVGWYHTHLIQIPVHDASADAADDNAEDAADGANAATELFFSLDDRFMHRQFFADPWYVALVLGSQGGAAFFRWFGDQISANRRFYVTAD